jgi:hypothetical protein
MWMNQKKIYPQFSIGETVKIKSREEITRSLNGLNEQDGCAFTEQMWQYCGRTYTILKIVNSYFNEHCKRTFVPKCPVYILEKSICEGSLKPFLYKCDHSCFLLWHEDWLEKSWKHL